MGDIIKRHDVFALILVLCISTVPLLAVHLPRALSFEPIAFSAVLVIWYRYLDKKTFIINKFYVVSILCTVLLGLLSVSWSLNPSESFQRIIKVFAILAGGIIPISLAYSIDVKRLSPYLWLFPIGITLASLLCSIEMLTDMPLYNLIHSPPVDKHINTSVLNRGILTIVLSYLVCLFFIKRMTCGIYIAFAMTLSVLAMLYLTQSQSAQLAFIIGITILFLFPARYDMSYKALSLIIALALACSPLIVIALFNLLGTSGQEVMWLKNGYAGNRSEIWHFVMRYALNNPWYGYGIEATRFVESFEHDHIYHKANTVLHPHNFVVQLWMEFGIVGVVSASLLFSAISQKITTTDYIQRKHITCVYIPFILVASISYGMWQSWWLGLIIYLIMLCILIARTESPSPSPKKINN